MIKKKFPVEKKNRYKLLPPGNLINKRIQEANDGIDMDSNMRS